MYQSNKFKSHLTIEEYNECVITLVVMSIVKVEVALVNSVANFFYVVYPPSCRMLFVPLTHTDSFGVYFAHAWLLIKC